jgi:hypothetical protein
VRSLRAKRGRFIAACFALATGLAFVTLSADWRDRVIRPGPLAPQHAQLLERGGGTANCRACHEAAAQNVAGWATSLVVGHGDVPSQSQLCMNCHSKSIATEHALAAHNLPASVLGKITIGEASHTQDVACATCHREHHGAQVSLTAIDNAACQWCHQQRYASFAADHPDFGAWPYERRTRIAFNHATHSGKYFADKKQAFDCRGCHVSDPSGHVERLASYEKACAACHEEKIATSMGRGVAMISLPTLDVAAMKRAGRDIGPWPQSVTGDFDGKLPPAMKLLLAGDPAAAVAIAKLRPEFEFQDLNAGDARQVAASADVATAIKTLISDVVKRGPAAVRERLSAVLGRQISDAELVPLVAGLSTDTVRGAVNWLPGLNVGVDEWPVGATGTKTGVGNSNRPTAFAAGGAWSRDDAALAIRYRPAAHADPVLSAWLDVLARTPNLESRPVAAAMFKELTKATAPGLCASCHSIEQNAAGALMVNWTASDRSAQPRTFTKFSHGPHLVLPQLENCASCHAVSDSANSAANTDSDPRQFVSDFKPMAKQQCAECHTKSAAGDACQSCHNYHVQTAEAWRLAAPAQQLNRQAWGRGRPGSLVR